MDPQSLLLFLSLRQPRRIRVVENVLAGRKTVSNLYWGMRYGLLDYLGSFKSVDKTRDQKLLTDLINQKLITTPDHREYLLTPQGYQQALNLKKYWYRPRFLKYNLHYDLKRFRDRVLLSVQAVSEYSHHNRNYYPLQIDYRDANLVKEWFYYFKPKRLIKRSYNFLVRFLKRLDRLDPTLGWQAVNLLVGHHNPGQTLSQQGHRLHQPIGEMWFRQLDILGALVADVTECSSLFSPLLTGLRISPVSSSAQRTYDLARRGLNFRQISRTQAIRLSTVKEHLLGVAIFVDLKAFPFKLFLPDSLMKSLSAVYRGNLDCWDYTRFESLTGQHLDFFYFRLFQILRSKQNER